MAISSSSPCGVIEILIYTNKNHNVSKIVIYFEYFKVFIHLFLQSKWVAAAKVNAKQYLQFIDKKVRGCQGICWQCQK